jgi:hypothetical protein
LTQILSQPCEFQVWAPPLRPYPAASGQREQAEQATTTAPDGLTAAQIDEYFAKGFLVLRGAIDGAEHGALAEKVHIGSYPIVTFQYSSTTLYQFSYSVAVFLK